MTNEGKYIVPGPNGEEKVYPMPPEYYPERDEIWMNGWCDGIDMKRTIDFTSIIKKDSYEKGFRAGLEWNFKMGKITNNQYRQLLGLPEEPSENAMVVHPSHYTFGKYEVIDVLNDWQLPYPLDNVVKYSARAGKKGEDLQKEIEDLEKARFYLNYRIAYLGGTDWNPENRK